MSLALTRFALQPPTASVALLVPFGGSTLHSGKRSRAFAALFALQLVMSCASLYQTYAFGYHSARQMLYGAALALAAVAILVVLFVRSANSTQLPRSVAICASAFLLGSALTLTAVAPHRVKALDAAGAVACACALTYMSSTDSKLDGADGGTATTTEQANQ